MRAVAVALEVQDAVDEVLEDAGPRDVSVLRHVPDEERGDAQLLRHAEHPARCLADLGHRARRRAELRRVERLHGVDHAHVGPLPLEGGADLVEVRLRQDVHVGSAAEPVGAELHLRRRLLTRDEQDPPVGAQRAERHQQERRLPDPRVAADEDEARGHEPAAENAVELGDARRDPLGVGRLDVDEAEQRPSCRLSRAFRHRGDPLLDERAPASARRALAEPLPGRVPALGAGVLDCRGLCHGRPIVGPGSDVSRLLGQSRDDAGTDLH